MISAKDRELGVLATNVYVRADQNIVLRPSSWSRLPVVAVTPGEDAAGFNGAAYFEATSGRLVIAFEGTGPGWEDWTEANAPMAFGACQKAARYVSRKRTL